MTHKVGGEAELGLEHKAQIKNEDESSNFI